MAAGQAQTVLLQVTRQMEQLAQSALSGLETRACSHQLTQETFECQQKRMNEAKPNLYDGGMNA
jgi:hypothetical protein